MLLKHLLIAVSLTLSQAKDNKYEVEEELKPSYEAKIYNLPEVFNLDVDAKMSALKEEISRTITETFETKLEEIIVHHIDLQIQVENLGHGITYIRNYCNKKYAKLKKELLETINKTEIQNNKLNVIEKELQSMKSVSILENNLKPEMPKIPPTLLPEIPQVTVDTKNFALVEINLESLAYNQLVKKKDSVEINVSWITKNGRLPNISKVLLNSFGIWYGAGDATSASFKIRHGGRYQITVELCNINGCVSSDSTEIIVADTDGSHIPPSEIPSSGSESSVQIPKKVLAAYFMEWGVYDKRFPVGRVPVSDLTHLIYSLIPICGGDGINDSLKKNMVTFDGLQNSCAGREDFKVAIEDTWAALKMPLYNFSTYNEPYLGSFGGLMMLKRSKPDLKILMSVGGSTFSDPFSLLDDKSKRDTLIASVKEFLQTWKFFDGVDIMWLDPKTLADGKIYVHLMKEMREMLNELSVETEKMYELTSAISAKWDIIQLVDYNEAQKYIDHIFLMSYGFKETKNVLGYDASLFAPEWNPQESYTADYATKTLCAQGVKSEKIVLGIFLYGQGWTGVHDYKDDNPFTGNATDLIKGTWEKGRVYYNQIYDEIALGQWEYHYDIAAEAPYVFRNETGDLISFDDPRSTMAKAKYVRDYDLGGLFARGIDADNGDILKAMRMGLEKN